MRKSGYERTVFHYYSGFESSNGITYNLIVRRDLGEKRKSKKKKTIERM